MRTLSPSRRLEASPTCHARPSSCVLPTPSLGPAGSEASQQDGCGRGEFCAESVCEEAAASDEEDAASRAHGRPSVGLEEAAAGPSPSQGSEVPRPARQRRATSDDVVSSPQAASELLHMRASTSHSSSSSSASSSSPHASQLRGPCGNGPPGGEAPQGREGGGAETGGKRSRRLAYSSATKASRRRGRSLQSLLDSPELGLEELSRRNRLPDYAALSPLPFPYLNLACSASPRGGDGGRTELPAGGLRDDARGSRGQGGRREGRGCGEEDADAEKPGGWLAWLASSLLPLRSRQRKDQGTAFGGRGGGGREAGRRDCVADPHLEAPGGQLGLRDSPLASHARSVSPRRAPAAPPRSPSSVSLRVCILVWPDRRVYRGETFASSVRHGCGYALSGGAASASASFFELRHPPHGLIRLPGAASRVSSASCAFFPREALLSCNDWSALSLLRGVAGTKELPTVFVHTVPASVRAHASACAGKDLRPQQLDGLSPQLLLLGKGGSGGARGRCLAALEGRRPLGAEGALRLPPLLFGPGGERRAGKEEGDDDEKELLAALAVLASSASLPRVPAGYCGHWERDKRAGWGVSVRGNAGLKYEGFWRDDYKEGLGVQTQAKGVRYVGGFRRGVRHGKGVLFQPTGSIYAGEWTDGYVLKQEVLFFGALARPQAPERADADAELNSRIQHRSAARRTPCGAGSREPTDERAVGEADTLTWRGVSREEKAEETRSTGGKEAAETQVPSLTHPFAPSTSRHRATSSSSSSSATSASASSTEGHSSRRCPRVEGDDGRPPRGRGRVAAAEVSASDLTLQASSEEEGMEPHDSRRGGTPRLAGARPSSPSPYSLIDSSEQPSVYEEDAEEEKDGEAKQDVLGGGDSRRGPRRERERRSFSRPEGTARRRPRSLLPRMQAYPRKSSLRFSSPQLRDEERRRRRRRRQRRQVDAGADLGSSACVSRTPEASSRDCAEERGRRRPLEGPEARAGGGPSKVPAADTRGASSSSSSSSSLSPPLRFQATRYEAQRPRESPDASLVVRGAPASASFSSSSHSHCSASRGERRRAKEEGVHASAAEAAGASRGDSRRAEVSQDASDAGRRRRDTGREGGGRAPQRPWRGPDSAALGDRDFPCLPARELLSRSGGGAEEPEARRRSFAAFQQQMSEARRLSSASACEEWSTGEVSFFFSAMDFPLRLTETLAAQDVDGCALLQLQEDDLKDMGIAAWEERRLILLVVGLLHKLKHRHAQRTLYGDQEQLEKTQGIVEALEIPAAELSLEGRLGEGGYSRVYRARWRYTRSLELEQQKHAFLQYQHDVQNYYAWAHARSRLQTQTPPSPRLPTSGAVDPPRVSAADASAPPEACPAHCPPRAPGAGGAAAVAPRPAAAARQACCACPHTGYGSPPLPPSPSLPPTPLLSSRAPLPPGSALRGALAPAATASPGDMCVAIKIFRQRELRALQRSFFSELSVLCRLAHPNIAMLLGVVSAPLYGLVTEYVPAGSLFDLLHMHRLSLSYTQVVRFARDICHGMRYLHQQGVLHCDLKSPNVLLGKRGEVKLCDFGLATLIETVPEAEEPAGTREARRLRPGENARDSRAAGTGRRARAAGDARAQLQEAHLGCVGTHHWMAPEVLRGEPFTAAADVYSFGMVLWEMLARKIPFEGMSSPAHIITAVGYGGATPVFSRFPPPLQDILARCLSHSPQLRPSFAWCAHQLQALYAANTLDVEVNLNTLLGLSE
ncbi:Tyrosine kinase-like (TKL) protein [Besnoitia besnoiti]|uniref:Tyrosine kinase-like (TKL) protein n=1 Tax=Besnoitia besnoiti TaxID=94643 RepID=A0A2A9MC88_BESBE|nr:Tyrosine kinase-like (TKL) protein [Besnoitia besnoiti]PFH33010.1 Tyrosine kinase-like (TKL) protein [Besnoitia besnoiti]